MKPKIKLLLSGFFLGAAVAFCPHDFGNFALCVIAALIGIDAWVHLEVRKKTYEEWRVEELKKPIP